MKALLLWRSARCASLAFALISCAQAGNDGQDVLPVAMGGAAGVEPSAGGAGGMTSGPAAGQGGVGGAAGMFTGGVGGGSGAGGVAGVSAPGGSGGVGGMGGAAGTAGAGGTSGMGAPSGYAPLCVDDPLQVVLVGDSYINWVSHSLPLDLATLGGAEGVWNRPPPAGTLYAVGGTSIGTGDIPAQLTNALADLEARVVVMDGGGNDVLLNALGQGCKDTGSSTMQVCIDIVAQTIDAFKGMTEAMAAEGVSDVVYFFYPHVPPDTLLGGPNPVEILDYAKPLWEAACLETLERTGNQTKCHFVDMIPVFEGHPEYFAPTDLHPNPTGSAEMAKAIWGRMVMDCVGQPSSSGCCVP